MTITRYLQRLPRPGRPWLLALLLFAATAAAAAEGATAQAGPIRKKLIEYGWDVPSIGYVHDHIRDMERLPFDGIIFRLNDLNHAFDTRRWQAAELDPQVDTLKSIQWQRFTDNFLCLYAANDSGMDWFDDAQWKTITANLRLAAKAARQAGCVGICFDPEPYGPNPWVFTSTEGTPDFARTSAQVRQRGAQFIKALQAGLPGMKLLTFYQLGMFAHLADEPNPARRQQVLASESYALYLAFIDGMLDGAAPDIRLIDGNESSYYYEDNLPYYRAYQTLHQKVLPLVSPANRHTYRAQADAGVALYVDQVLGLRTPPARYLSHYLTPEDQLRWFEHNVYWALETSDEYVWCYSERMNWWRGDYLPGLDQAVRSAREKLERPGTADVRIDDVLDRARQRMDEDLASRLKRPTATVQALAAGARPPTVDGSLEDAAWKTAPLEAFVPPVDVEHPLVGATQAWVTWDDRALYVALRCGEPRPDSLVSAGSKRDDEIWNGDTVELFLSLGEAAEPYVHLILNPSNVQWDGVSGGQIGDSSWDGQWRSAARRGQDAWTVELAIPWADVGGAPAPGSVRRANLCRQRALNSELSTWSMIVQGFIEPTHFGTWEFGGSPPATEAKGRR